MFLQASNRTDAYRAGDRGGKVRNNILIVHLGVEGTECERKLFFLKSLGSHRSDDVRRGLTDIEGADWGTSSSAECLCTEL